MTQWKQFLPAIKLRSMEVHKYLCQDRRFGKITADTIMHGNVLPSVLQELENSLTVLADYLGPDMAANCITSASCGKQNIDLKITLGGTVPFNVPLGTHNRCCVIGPMTRSLQGGGRMTRRTNTSVVVFRTNSLRADSSCWAISGLYPMNTQAKDKLFG